MAESMSRYRMVGDYMMEKQIGAGSFSTVWHARHRVNGGEVAVKEIVTSRLSSKLRESLKSEIYILKRIDHPNIIRLLDMIEESGKIYIILEYCKGGDLSVFIRQRQGKVSEETAKHFMLQLAEGLKVLRENNFIHRDLKPQNLLLSSNGDDSVLKIADFGFARSLQPRGLAETLCGSPLYMAPEIMQLQKYDAKADLWSVGAILFQLVTGKPPFTGSNQIELLQNIMRSTELKFPPKAVDLNPHCMDLCRKLLRRDPVERLTFEEFFNHAYLSLRQPDEILRQSNRVLDGFPLPKMNTEKTSAPSGSDGSLSFQVRPTVKPLYGFSLDTNTDRKGTSNPANKTEIKGSGFRSRQLSEGNLKTSLNNANLGLLDTSPKVTDSLESIDQDYVIVSGSVMDLQSSELPKSSHSSSKTDTKPLDPIASAPVPINQGATGRFDHSGIIETRLSTPEISQRSMDTADSLEQPSIDWMIRITSLQHYAAAITELVNDKVEGGKQLEAFSVQLVILATWKQALQLCHTHAASAVETIKTHAPLDICSEIEGAFLHEVGCAEELAKLIEPGNMEMPDAMELLYQSALALGKHGAVDEYMGDIESAVVFYSKAARLLMFLLVEAPCLILNPPFSLTKSQRCRIKSYIDVLNNRQSISCSQRMAVLKPESCERNS